MTAPSHRPDFCTRINHTASVAGRERDDEVAVQLYVRSGFVRITFSAHSFAAFPNVS